MYVATLNTRQIIPVPLERLFPFFSDATNLERITSSWLQFEVLTPAPIEIAAGTLIDYRLRWHRVPIRWRTEIEVWEPPFCFVDRQIRGPYRLWRHTHRFEEHRGGTLVEDTVEYSAPGGRLVHRLVVDRDVASVFAHRQKILEEIFSRTT